MFFLMISVHSCIIIHYIVEKSIFIIIVCKILKQQKNGKQTIKIPKKGEYIRFKNFVRKIKSPFRT